MFDVGAAIAVWHPVCRTYANLHGVGPLMSQGTAQAGIQPTDARRCLTLM